MNLGYFLTPYTKINSKWMKDLNAKQEAIKILEEKTGNNRFDHGHSNFLLDTSPEARETKAKMNPDHFLTPCTKINSKWMKDLNVRQEGI